VKLRPRKFYIAALVTIFISILSTSPMVSANQDDDCGFGRYVGDYDVNWNEICVFDVWTYSEDDDGFRKRSSLYIGGDNTDSDGNDFYLEVQCSKKKLSVLVYSDPVGMYPDVNLRGLGSAQVRIDSQKISNYSYGRMSDSSGIYLRSPKAFTTAILKGRSKVAVKIPALYGYEVANFPISDFADYSGRFKSLGCPLK